MANTMMQGRLGRALDTLAEGWRELRGRASNALTRFSPKSAASKSPVTALHRSPQWALLAGDIVETDKSIVVQLELPGVDKRDCDVVVDGDLLRVRGEKRVDRDRVARGWYVAERAYGAFERTIRLPPNAASGKARASFANGVLTVEMPKKAGARSGRLVVK